MKITDWTIYTPDKNFHVLVELHTDAGHSGWGAAFSQTDQVLGAFSWLKRFVVGESPLEIERVTEKLHQVSFWLGRGGAMTHAISAINVALWDVAGKILGQPVYMLLGGKVRKAVPAYGSVLFHPVDTLADRIGQMKAGGFRAIKLGWDPFGKGSVADDEKLISAARRAAGDETTLLIDAGGSYPHWPLRFKDALERAKMLANYGVYWFEEPLAPDDLEGYARLTDDVEIACAGTLARCLERGDAVSLIVMCNGNSASTSLGAEELAAVRSRELKDAARVLGVETLIELGLPDFGVWLQRETLFKLTDAIRQVRPDVVVVHSTDRSGKVAPWGELMTTVAKRNGAVGCVCDAFVRDCTRIIDMGFPVYCAGLCPLDSKGRGRVMAYDVPVQCGDIVVESGQIIFADYDGIVVIPREAEETVIQRAMEKVEGENKTRLELQAGKTLREVYDKYGIL